MIEKNYKEMLIVDFQVIVLILMHTFIIALFPSFLG